MTDRECNFFVMEWLLGCGFVLLMWLWSISSLPPLP